MKFHQHDRHSFTLDHGLASRLCALYGAVIMSTVTIQQFKQDIATWLGVVGHGEPVIITEQGRVIAQLTPPNEGAGVAVPSRKSMDEWLNEQEQRMQRIFGNRVVPDSAAVINDMRG